jgi:hypothetical protein
MSKQVEVPEGIVEAAMGGLPESWREQIEDSLSAALPSIYKRFCDRLLSDEAVAKALTAAQDVNWDVHRDHLRDHPEGRPTNRDVVKAALTAALQAASISADCNCSYDRLVTQEQAFAIRAACPVHGAKPQKEEGR